MATATQLSVLNQALLAIGVQSQISSLNEGSAAANAASVLYTPRFEALARSANWNCLRAQASLTLQAAAQGTPENPQGTTLPLPPVGWLYQYALPANCLQMRFIVPSVALSASGVPLFSIGTSASTSFTGRERIPYVVAYATDSSNNPLQVILTNQSQAIAVYTVNQPNPQIWDSLFEQAMVATLAAWFVPALSLHMPLMNMQIKIAEGLVQQARVRDGDEGTTSMDHLPDFIRARSGASGFYGANNSTCQGYTPLSWPSYY